MEKIENNVKEKSRNGPPRFLEMLTKASQIYNPFNHFWPYIFNARTSA